jgi:hypothetical protein
VGGDDEAADRRLVNQVHERELERERATGIVAEELRLDHHRVSRRRSGCRPLQGDAHGWTVGLGRDVDQRHALDAFGVPAQHAGQRAGHRLDVAVGGHQHGDGGGVVDERTEAGHLVVGHFEAAPVGEIA